MTALAEFQRLEAPGIWRDIAGAQRRDVIVAFGDATLTISTGANQTVAHWSLAAVTRLNPGLRPALFAPGDDTSETLEVADDVMVDAIEKVRKAVLRGAPHPRRLRLVLMMAVFGAIFAAGIFWLPGAMNRYAASVVPPSTRASIGQQVLVQMQALTGSQCSTPRANRSLATMLDRLKPGHHGKIVVARGIWPSRNLPGGMIVLDARVLEDHQSPDAAAGFVLAELQRLSDTDPLVDLLGFTGLRSAVQLLTSGQIDPARLRGYAEHQIATDPAQINMPRLIEAFRLARVSTEPYAYALDITGETTIDLIEANPITAQTAQQVLPDADWVNLQAICED